jgi:hypothetical protein
MWSHTHVKAGMWPNRQELSHEFKGKAGHSEHKQIKLKKAATPSRIAAHFCRSPEQPGPSLTVMRLRAQQIL